MWAAVRPLAMAGAEEPPGVAVACFVGDGVPTPVEARYLDPRVRYSAAGDGTVAAQGLAACGRWAGRQAEAVEVRTFQGVQYAGILADDRAFREVMLALTQAGGAERRRSAGRRRPLPERSGGACPRFSRPISTLYSWRGRAAGPGRGAAWPAGRG